MVGILTGAIIALVIITGLQKSKLFKEREARRITENCLIDIRENLEKQVYMLIEKNFHLRNEAKTLGEIIQDHNKNREATIEELKKLKSRNFFLSEQNISLSTRLIKYEDVTLTEKQKDVFETSDVLKKEKLRKAFDNFTKLLQTSK